MSGGGAGGPPGDREKKRNDLTTAVTVQTVSKKVDSRGGGGDSGGMSGCCSNLARRACTKKQLQKKLPILSWLPRYTGNFAISDIIAGVTVGLTVIPQVIRYKRECDLSSFSLALHFNVFRALPMPWWPSFRLSMAFTRPSWAASCTFSSGRRRT